jgi:lysozyme family protein
MSADYRKFVPFILRWEGGEVNDKNDRGGHTNKGITRTTFNALSKKVLGKEPNLDNFKNLSRAEAILIIRYFWNRATLNNQIKSQAVAEAITSWMWGSGNYGIKEWQRMLRDRFGKKDIVVDGAVGKQTINYTNSIPEKQLMAQAILAREQTFRKLVKNDPSQARFIKGWLNRLSDFHNRHKDIIETTVKLSATGLVLVFGTLFFCAF